MASKRTYNDACGIGRALDIVGERWALHVVRELLLGPKRFTDLRTSLPHVSPDILSQRLRELEGAGVLQKRKLPPPVSVQVYELTARGLALEPTLIELGRWGGANAQPPCDSMCMSTDAHVVSLCTLFDPSRADSFEVTVNLRFGDYEYRATVAGAEIAVSRGAADAPDLTIVGAEGAMLAVAHGRRELTDAVASGDLSIEGDAKTAARFLGLFPIPAPA